MSSEAGYEEWKEARKEMQYGLDKDKFVMQIKIRFNGKVLIDKIMRSYKLNKWQRDILICENFVKRLSEGKQKKVVYKEVSEFLKKEYNIKISDGTIRNIVREFRYFEYYEPYKEPWF